MRNNLIFELLHQRWMNLSLRYTWIAPLVFDSWNLCWVHEPKMFLGSTEQDERNLSNFEKHSLRCRQWLLMNRPIIAIYHMNMSLARLHSKSVSIWGGMVGKSQQKDGKKTQEHVAPASGTFEKVWWLLFHLIGRRVLWIDVYFLQSIPGCQSVICDLPPHASTIFPIFKLPHTPARQSEKCLTCAIAILLDS